MIRLFYKQLNNIAFIGMLFFIGASQSVLVANPNPFGDKRAEEIKKLMWETVDSEFKVTEIPEKWNGKSAVIIAKEHFLSYRKPAFAGVLQYDHYFHHRVKLLDQSAVEEFSQFSFPGSRKKGRNRYDVYSGYKIIKSDGREVEVSLENAVKQEQELNNEEYEYYKLAVPNLEIGDIIDYYIAEEQEIVQNITYHIFDPKLFQLNDDYPIMKQKISFDVMRRCYINLKTLNGAPKFKNTRNEKGDLNKWVLEYSDSESAKDLRWFFPNRQLPTVKFQVIYASATQANDLPFFLGKPEEVKSEVSKEEMEYLIRRFYGMILGNTWEVRKYMKKNFKKEKDKNVFAREAYYAFRHFNEVKYEEAATVKGYNGSRNNLKDLIGLSQYFRREEIPHEFLVTVPRFISHVDDVILMNELEYLIKVNTSEPFYIGNFSNYSTPTIIPEDLQGVEAYSVDGSSNLYNFDMTKTSIPKMSYKDNNGKSKIEIEIADLDSDKVEISVRNETKGINKQFYQKYLLDYYHYVDEDKERYEIEENFEERKRKEREGLLKKKEEYLQKRDENLEENLKTIVENDLDFKVEEVGEYKVIETGRYEDSPAFIYTFKAELSDVVKRVGQNYLLEIGKFIGGQVDLSEEEKDRQYDIYQPYARSFDYQIVLNIPEGFTVEGVDKLNKNVENETGGFISEAKIEDGKLIVDTKKYYSDNYFQKEKWPLMVEFLEAAHDFSQVQILLKKDNL
ncbi:DUF3857 domain-containing protein [Mangrovivirga cuniculi]|uniref:DUF3857 domain-containing protein n=1 Tax=Mangrovivirga cuniculi TaxID=2715131 RepID=A0A4D7JUA9_9BACT|nr:DUF3857 domain-containing protein [Mangrovivirga cuniculi]QCK16192.1 hypothetical protein DCC35_16295 [Mangrovivirga cuniculi]